MYLSVQAELAEDDLHFPVFFKCIVWASSGNAMGFTHMHKCSLKAARKLCSSLKFQWQKPF